MESEEIEQDREGSPPRVREGLDDIKKAMRDMGITPACAGRTSEFNSIVQCN